MACAIAGLGVAWVLAASVVEPPPRGKIDVRWEAPPGCGDAERVRAHAERRRGDGSTLPVTARARVWALDGATWAMALEIATDGARERREIRAASCDALTEAAGLLTESSGGSALRRLRYSNTTDAVASRPVTAGIVPNLRLTSPVQPRGLRRVYRPMTSRMLSLALFMAVLACDSKTEEAGKKDDKKTADAKSAKPDAADAQPDAKPADGGALPTETESLALDQGDSKIPATIDVPKGSTTFNDDPTSIRIEYGEGLYRGKLFGVEVEKGNEFNVNLDETEKKMLESKYSKNAILEKTTTLLRWTMQNEGSEPNHKFTMIVDLAGTKWVCEDGNYGGWTEAESKRQQQACATLAAK